MSVEQASDIATSELARTAGPGLSEPVPASGRSGLLRATVAHLQDPMRRSSYALIIGTGLTSALGLLFWAIAARLLPDATVGVGAALVSAITLLANFSSLGLRNGLVRFLPAAGVHGRRLIAVSYALCAGTAVLMAAVFLIGQPVWADRLGFLRSSPQASIVFVAAVAIWVIFVLQDNVLLAQRRATWVPIANGICSVGKIALLPVLSFSAVWAIFAATVLPALAAVVLITVLVLRRPRTAPEPAEPIPVGRLVRFAATDHVSALLWLGTADILTLVILHEIGPEASAYYFIATTIGYSLYLITSNVGSALLAEGARYPERTVALARQSAVNAARLVIPLAALGCLLAPFVLGLLGPSYAANGTLLLQLILVSAIPQIIVAVAMSTARLRQDLKLIIVIYGFQSLGMLGGSTLLIGPWGLPGVGFSCLATASLIAAALLVTRRTGLLTGDQVRPVHGADSGPLAAVLRLGALRRRSRARRELRRRLPAALAATGLPADTRGRLLTSDCDNLIYGIDRAGSPLVLKIATSEAASTGLDRHAETLDRLTTTDLPGSVRSWLPRIEQRRTVDGRRVLLETRLPGEPATARAYQPAVTGQATAALTQLHDATAELHVVDTDLLHAWVDEPLQVLRGQRSLARYRSELDRVQEILTTALAGRQLRTASTHGDFWPGNTLITAAPDVPAVTGLVDWENARPVGLPAADLLHWWLSVRPEELGSTVASILATGASGPDLDDLAHLSTDHDVAVEDLVLLTWLWHVSDGLRRSSRNAVGRVWLRRNVRPVLQAVGRSTR